MPKTPKVNYPKKKPRIKLEDLGDVSEPERCSMYKILEDNLKIANRVTFLHRIIYVGGHKFDTYGETVNVFEKIITKCNETYCFEKLTGFLLFYQDYFVHMVEGDEDNLNKHLGYLLDKTADHYPKLGIIKLLIHVSNINQRFGQNWISYTGTPPKLMEKLDVNCDLQQWGRIIYNAIKKLYLLVESYCEEFYAEDKKPIQSGISIYESEMSVSKMFSSMSATSNSEMLERGGEQYKYLPEIGLLDFIIHSNYTMNLQEYFDLYGNVPMRDIYKDRVWPVPHDFIPYDVFEKPYDCITKLPNESKKSQIMSVPTMERLLVASSMTAECETENFANKETNKNTEATNEA